MTKDDVPSRFAVDFAGATLLGIYRVAGKIADGGMGSVWLGEDTNLGRKVVVKVPHVRFLGEPGFRARFTQEITELVRLEHPSIVRIQAQGVHEEIPFFVLQYLGGGSLEDRLEAAGPGPRDLDAAVPWLRTISDTLDFIHGRGVVHRDVKPENILFDEEGHVFLSDFGVVKALDQELNVTEAGTGVGSPKYMAPEQGFGRSVEGAADQYGLATTVFEAIAGRLPFAGASALELLLNKQKDTPVHLADIAEDLPTECAEAVMRGLAVDPDERFPSCQEFADAFLAGAGVFDRTPPTGAPTVAEIGVKVPRRSRFVAVGLVALLAAVVLAVGLSAGWFTPAKTDPDDGGEEGAFEVVLISNGAEPRRALRYRPSPGAEETMVIGITSEESESTDGAEPVKTSLPGIGARIGIKLTGVEENGDAAYAWRIGELRLEAAEGAPAPVREAMLAAGKSLEGRSGTGRQSARGIGRELSHDGPPVDDPGLQALDALITEIVSQVSTPLPKEPVGVGARWEITTSKFHIEGLRFTQTVTYELESLSGNEARIRLFVTMAAAKQTFTHPDIPSDTVARLQRSHGDGEGELVIDLDRLSDRSLWMTVRSMAELSIARGEEETEMTLGRSFRYEMKRE